MVLVLDCSGSMEGKSIALAKQATRRAVEMLGPRDQMGIIAFEDKNWWVSPLHVCNDKEQVLRSLDTIAAGGETDMYPALDKAYLALRESSADLKHVIVLTDGVSAPGDFDGLAKQIAAAGITLSTVAIGEEAAGPLLQDIAATAKGHCYYCDDVARVPQIFDLETSMAGKVGITEEPFFPKVVHGLAHAGRLGPGARADAFGLRGDAGQAGRAGCSWPPRAAIRCWSSAVTAAAACWPSRPTSRAAGRRPGCVGPGSAAFGCSWSARRCARSRRRGPGDARLSRGVSHQAGRHGALAGDRQSSGGRYDPPPAELLAPSGRTVPETICAWRELLLAAVVLFLVDLLVEAVRVEAGLTRLCHWLYQCWCVALALPCCRGLVFHPVVDRNGRWHIVRRYAIFTTSAICTS